jgi:hypothetical protein
MRQGSVRALGCVLVALALTACGGGGEQRGEKEKRVPAMDMRQAGERAEAILDGTMAAIQPPVTWSYGYPMKEACGNGLNRPTGTTSVNRTRHVLTVISEQRRGNLLGVVQRYWEQHGFTIQSVTPDKDMPSVRARNSDGFTVSLAVGSIGNVHISAGYSCAKDSPMTYPKGTPGEPGGPKTEELTPRVQSDFWSAEHPITP